MGPLMLNLAYVDSWKPLPVYWRVNASSPCPLEQPGLSAQARPERQGAADLLGVSRSHIFRLLRDGTLTRIKVGGRTLIRRAEVEGLIG